MVDLNTILAGLSDVITPAVLIAILAGVVISQFIGALPGVGPVMVMAIAVPYTLTFDPLTGIAFLVATMKGGTIGGAIPAIILNTPGTPDSALTTLDGYPMAQKGQARKALKMSVYSSVTGDTFSDLVLIGVSAPLAVYALRMGPVEIFALMVLAFAVIAGLSGRSLGKAMVAAGLGLFLATIGLDPTAGTPRLYFGYFELFDGLPLVTVAIGTLVLSEIVLRLATKGGGRQPAIQMADSSDPADSALSFSEYWSCRFIMLRGAVIGTLIGALPGIGSTAAASISYTSAKAAAKDSSSFGKGDIRGLSAVESANSAVSGANMIPLLTLGIPGSVTAALILSAFLVHGIQPGPRILVDQGRLIYGLFGAMILANAMNFAVGMVGWRLWVQVARAPSGVIYAAAIILCVVGSTVLAGGMFGLIALIACAALGILLKLYDYPLIVFIIAFFLGPQFERSLGQAMALLRGDPRNLVNFPIAVTLLVVATALLVAFLLRQRRERDADVDTEF
jgi:putative tricarboxylic transport membrane protein